jgi:hypothetical protein
VREPAFQPLNVFHVKHWRGYTRRNAATHLAGRGDWHRAHRRETYDEVIPAKAGIHYAFHQALCDVLGNDTGNPYRRIQ